MTQVGVLGGWADVVVAAELSCNSCELVPEFTHSMPMLQMAGRLCWWMCR